MTDCKEITLNPSVANRVNIEPIYFGEKVFVYFKLEENWAGSYLFKLWNSEAKNTEFTISGALMVVDDLMTLKIEPTAMNLSAGKFYYEISNDTDKRLIFNGNITIKK
jgi:hypothetical protein